MRHQKFKWGQSKIIGVRSTLISNQWGQRLRGADNKWGQININFLCLKENYEPNKLMLI